jgi:hypothetical protein
METNILLLSENIIGHILSGSECAFVEKTRDPDPPDIIGSETLIIAMCLLFFFGGGGMVIMYCSVQYAAV